MLWLRFFSFSFISWHRCNVALRYLLAFGSKTFISKKSSWPLTQKLRARIIADQYCSCSPVNDCNFASTSTSLYNSLDTFAVKSQISLWHMETNPPFLQLMLSWKSYFEPHAHAVGKLLNGQPYRILMPSQNCYLFKSKPYSFSGYAFNQFEILSRAPFRLIVFVLR